MGAGPGLPRSKVIAVVCSGQTWSSRRRSSGKDVSEQSNSSWDARRARFEHHLSQAEDELQALEREQREKAMMNEGTPEDPEPPEGGPSIGELADDSAVGDSAHNGEEENPDFSEEEKATRQRRMSEGLVARMSTP